MTVTLFASVISTSYILIDVGIFKVLQSSPQSMIRCRAPSIGVDVDMVSEFDPSSSDSGVVSRCAVVKPLKFRLCQPIFGRKTHHKAKIKQTDESLQQIKQSELHDLSLESADKEGITTESIKLRSGPGEFGVHAGQMCAQPVEVIKRVQKPRDPEREKKRIARKKEKRATLILGLIMGSFIACWLPFFFLYILTPCCPSCNVPESAFAIAFWLGYTNSALNPVIYTIFNKDFRSSSGYANEGIY
ncbi:alpha-2Db adrenergic receptor-like [Ctenocephalides felis]|uniref:alpha-2Db adrenergic receptor-like n=1 Tax=Ctenocephalides felis TaxID=7515 RepID=UPI000E6E4E8E|nr:alpha-2Db adrenergic receptor-like [Ctenocephalides felis]